MTLRTLLPTDRMIPVAALAVTKVRGDEGIGGARNSALSEPADMLASACLFSRALYSRMYCTRGIPYNLQLPIVWSDGEIATY